MRIGGTNSDYIIHSSTSIPHPDWNDYTIANNIAIIELNEPIEFGNTAQPICLANSNDYPTKNVIAGSLGRNGVNYRNESILERNECETYWGELSQDTLCLTANWINWDCCGASGNILAIDGKSLK